ncbi:hypothetical protein ACWDSF_06860 [Nocardia beijingensis]
MVERVGLQSAQRLWDYLATSPNQPPLVGKSSKLKGKAGRPTADGWSGVHHYEASSMVRVDYRYHDAFVGLEGDAHRVVAILTINYSSH